MINELSSCLALVRPAGMHDDAATEWLAVAATEVHDFATLRPGLFKLACGEARRECTHHGQIVPKILANQFHDWERELGYDKRGLRAIAGPKREEQAALPDNVSKLVPDLRASRNGRNG